MDPMHGAYLHAKSHSMAFGDKKANMRIENTESGLIFEKEGQREVDPRKHKESDRSVESVDSYHEKRRLWNLEYLV